MMAAKNVTMIPATLNLHTRVPKSSSAKRKVAGYLALLGCSHVYCHNAVPY